MRAGRVFTVVRVLVRLGRTSTIRDQHGHKNVLTIEFAHTLLHGPNVNHYSTAWFQNANTLFDGVDASLFSAKVVYDTDRNDRIEQVRSEWQVQVVTCEQLVLIAYGFRISGLFERGQFAQ